ncbi:MAG: hypothetical protein ACJ796_07770 [Gemmatimonadaceae bacterium]
MKLLTLQKMWRSVVVGAAAFITGCGGSTEPKSSFIGTFVLVRLNTSAAPPYLMNGPSLGGTAMVSTDTLVLTSTGSYEHRIRSPDFTAPLTFRGSFKQNGEGVVFTATQDDAFQSADFEADTLRVVARIEAPWTLGYVRVR